MKARASLLTPSGRSAVAVIGVAGENAVAGVDQHFRAANSLPLGDQPLRRIVYGRWGAGEGEDLIVCRLGPDQLEIHCHGGYQSAPQILDDLCSHGCVEEDWSTWLSREATCPFAAQAQIALAKTLTLRGATILLDQYHGALRQAWAEVVALLQDKRLSEAQQQLQHLLQRSELGLHLTKPWRVVVAGRPNVGKSSLVNALAGFERAIVYDQPGTTRDVVSIATAVAGWPLELSDTAGLHRTSEEIEAAGIALATAQLLAADLVLWILDATEIGQQAPFSLASEQAEGVGIKLQDAQTLVVVNKIDLAAALSGSMIRTSAISGEGVESLLEEIAARLVPHSPRPGAAVPFTTEQVDALQTVLSACENQAVDKALSALLEF